MPDIPEAANPYLDLMQGEVQRTKATEAATLTTALDTNPDQYATQKRVAGYLGYPVAAVEATPEASAREAQQKQIQQDSAPHPVLQQKYGDTDFAKLAHDDSGTLSKLGDAITSSAKYVFSAPDNKNTLAGDLVAGYHDAGQGAAGVFRAVADVGASAAETFLPGVAAMEKSGTLGGDPLRRLAEGFAMLGQDSSARAKEASPPTGDLVQGGVSSGVRSFVGNTLSLPLALLGPGGEAAALYGMSAQQGGQSYQEARDKGVPMGTALPYAMSQAVIEYATEKLPLHALIGDVKTGSSMLKTLGHQIAAEVPGEQLATILQDMNEWAVLPENKDKPFSSYLADRPGAAAQTLIATVIGIGGNVAVMKSAQSALDNATGAQRQVQEADQGVEQLKQMFTLAGQSKLRERAPAHLADFIQQQAESTEGAPTEVYIDARTLAGEGGLLNQEKVGEMLPSVAPQLIEALQTGGDVSIPIGELLTNVAGTPLEEKILEHLRTTPEALSQFEAKQAQEQAAEFLKSEAGKVVEQAQDATDLQNSADAVKNTVLQQLNTANRFTPEVHEAYASLVRDFYTATSARLGMNPEEMYRAYPLRVDAATPTLNEEPRTFNQSAVLSAERPVTSTVTDRKGDQFHVAISKQAFGQGQREANSVMVELRDPKTNERRGFIDFSIRPDGVLTSEMSKVAPDFRGRGLAEQMYSAARAAGYDIAPGKVQTDMGLAMVERLQAKGLINKEAEGKRFKAGDLELEPLNGDVLRQDAQTQTEAFKKWFGDSKVVDANGQPKVMYHGTTALDKIETEGFKKGWTNVTDSKPVADSYQEWDRGGSPGTVALYVKAENPAYFDAKGQKYTDIGNKVFNATWDAEKAGHDAIIIQNIRDHSDSSVPTAPHTTVVVFNSSQLKSATGNSGAFDPNNPSILAQGPRGTFDPGALKISLLENADLSTFLHETGHFFLEVMADVSAQPNAAPMLAEDMGTVLKWFGVKDLATWNAMSLDEQRPYHEKFAESFEQYLFEGKAPNQALSPLFQRFRSWMTNVYKSLSEFMASHNTKLSSEVRGVFNRLIATDESIQSAEEARAYAPLFKSAAEAGMTPQEWAAYQAIGQRSTDEAISELDKRSLRDMRWTTNAHAKALKELQKGTESKRKAVEAEVKQELAAQPVEQARAYVKELQKGEAAKSAEHKTAMREWRDQYATAKTAATEAVKGDESFKTKAERKLEVDRRMLQWEAEHEAPQPKVSEGDLDAAAELFGYTSGDEMMRAMRNVPPMAELVEGMTDQRLLERYGDLTTVQGMQKAADEAVHNEARARFIASGLKSLQEGGKQSEKTPGSKVSVNVLVKAAKEYAAELISRRKVRDVKPGQHLSAETRAGKAALAAVAKGDTKLAIASQRDQLLNHFAARYSAEALEEIEKKVKYLRGFETNTTLPSEYRDQIDRLLDRFDLRRTPLNAVDKRKTLLDWVESQRAIGIDPDLPPDLLNEAMRQNYRDMTVEEFRGLVDTVKQIEHLGRLKDKLLTAKDQRDYEATRDAIAASIVENAGTRSADTRTPTTNAGRAWASIKNFAAAHIKAATLARVLDGGKDGGPMWEYFVRSANSAGDKETTMRADATKKLSDILAPYFDSGKLGGKGVYFPSVKRSFNRESILTIALNTGNAGNLQRLLGGENWTVEQLKPILDTLGAKDWRVVQSVWDYFESFKPEIAAKSKRVYGVEPDWVEPTARKVELQGGESVDLKGGYYPIKYDPAASVRAEEHADAEGAKRQLQGAYGAATTRRSFTKTRAEEVSGRPLLYTLSGVYSGVNDVIHDLSWHEWLIDVNRLMKSQTIDSAIREHYGPEVVRQFKSWRDAVAEGDSGSNEALDMALSKLRQGVSIAGLGFNFVSAAMQPLGIAQSMVRIGPVATARGITQYLANPLKATADVQGQSEFMAKRAQTRFRELNELKNKVQGESKARNAISTSAYYMMMQFQQMVDIPTWLGAYDKAIGEGNEDDRAKALADQAVIDAQGSGQTKDLSAIERGGPAQKLFTVFYSFMNTAQNLGYASRNTNQSYPKIAADAVMLFVVPAVLGALLKNAMTPGDSGDDKDWKTLTRKLLGEQISFILGLMVVTREFAEAGKTAAGVSDHPRDYAGPAGVRLVSDVSTLAKQAQQHEFDDQFRKALINVLGDVGSLPSAQLNRTITGIQALKEGKTKNPMAIAFGFQEPHK